MRFHPLAIAGAFVVEPERRDDERGFFARSWCRDEFDAQGLEGRLAQCSVSFNTRRGTLRGLHYQVAPFEEVKLVRCTRGAIVDVVLDLRPDSPTYLRHSVVPLSAATHGAVYVPRGVAHGFQTLEDGCEVFYQISEVYAPRAARGVRWNDPRFGIKWPIANPIMSLRDRCYPDYAPPDLLEVAS
ncbi:MAG TPA: dTDP-4-dehydrorhamnose 3,5-epimerase [Methylomirabilota bacterium]|jgi:dTDP-4-dehydrorhamnose 3,5-epimerase|nr:dTDP-4-dehydrorhamnose 3,5-epimerase [Methylomirabilota bacterium]